MVGHQIGHARPEQAGRDGFVLPVVIFGLVIMSTLAVAALLTAGDEQKSARAVMESASAFYAAEAGFNELWAAWPDTQVLGLEPGDTLDLGWRALDHGASYRAVVYRVDNGGQKMYELTVEGRGGGPLGGQRMLGLTIAADAGAGGGASSLPPWSGVGAVTGRGGFSGAGNNSRVYGFDTRPSGSTWNWDDHCEGDTLDAAGVVWDDADNVMTGNGGEIYGNPPVQEDSDLSNDEHYWKFGDVTWDSLVSMAEYTIDNLSIPFEGATKVSDGQCVHPWSGSGWGTTKYNFGSPKPDNACFDYFPIVYAKGQNSMMGRGQGILIVDGHLDMASASWYGLIIVRGCLLQGNGGAIYGAVLVDHQSVSGCGGMGFGTGNDSKVYWSSCAVQRTIEHAGVAFNHGDQGEEGFRLLGSRSFSEMLR